MDEMRNMRIDGLASSWARICSEFIERECNDPDVLSWVFGWLGPVVSYRNRPRIFWGDDSTPKAVAGTNRCLFWCE